MKNTRPPRSLLLALFFCAALSPGFAAEFQARWAAGLERVWIGPEYWANPLQDWRVSNGRLECLNPGPDRNVQLLTRQIGDGRGAFRLSVRIGVTEGNLKAARGSAGFRIGINGPLREYRNSLIKGAGLNAGITTAGELHLGQIGRGAGVKVPLAGDSVELRLTAEPAGENYQLTLSAHEPASGKRLGETLRQEFPAGQLPGNIALVSNYGPARRGEGGGAQTARFWFADWKVSGSKIEAHDDRAFGPILFSQYSLSRGVMKLAAQMPPIGPQDAPAVRLQIQPTGTQKWRTIGEEPIHPLARTATFRLENWEDTRDVPYRLVYALTPADGQAKDHYWNGTIRRDPIEKETLVVAGLSCHTDAIFPNSDLAHNLTQLNPDLLLNLGDQIYESAGGYGVVRAPVETAALDYLRKWYLYGWSFRELMRDRPSLCWADDHDVYQGNIWGAGGRSVPDIRDHPQGGYAMAAEWVNMVQRTLTSHHPDPFDPTPVEQGITVYYGDMLYGGVGFAILEDRKWKSGPAGLVESGSNRPDHVKNVNLDPRTLDVPGAEMLGQRQLDFLRQWAADWRGHGLKVVASQTIFANVANYHGQNQEYLVADLDSNGWPQTGRNQALREMRRGFMFHIAGDQHLPSLVQHGIEEWRDAGWSFCVPGVAVGYPRSWRPQQEGKVGGNRAPGMPDYTGDFVDGLGNKITVWAVGNPEVENRPGALERQHDKASGFGLLRLNKKARAITVECWRLLIDPLNPKPGDQFPGWPRTIHLLDNYARPAAAYLPTLRVEGMEDPVVQVIDEADHEVVYTLRISGTSFRPKVFREGNYTIKVGELGTEQLRTLKGVKSLPPDRTENITIGF